jgi:hypothetical protein
MSIGASTRWVLARLPLHTLHAQPPQPSQHPGREPIADYSGPS